MTTVNTARRHMALVGEALFSEARRIRDSQHGNRVTYSPKVFIPLTMLCRDKCGYCTFAQPPARLDAPYLNPDQVLEIANGGAEAGCHEALFTLGERPELRYPAAANWLRSQHYDSTVHYLSEMSKLVLTETGLLPHLNAGALTCDELTALRTVCPSQGMMIETLRDDLPCHRGAPDKSPSRRLATLEAAGKLCIPFTTGILVGIGEDRNDRIAALEAIANSHRQYGHVQEVIVQNFLPKPGTAMHASQPCPDDVYLDAIALARVLLPPDIHVQSPPNLSDDFGALLDVGIDDWGGVSPITPDHVNPERPWPAIERLAAISEERGFTLAPRLTAYPNYVQDPHRWFHPSLHFPILDRSDAEGLGRDDPGAFFPEVIETVTMEDGAEVRQIGRHSTSWYSGSPNRPPKMIPGNPSASGHLREILDGVSSGQQAEAPQLLALFSARGPEVAAVARVADELRRKRVGDDVTWVSNRNINYTNVCTFKCRFCGFSKGPLSLNLRGTPYLLEMDEIAERAADAARNGATEVCLQGGIHPDFDGDYYLDVIRAVRAVVPDIHIHGFTALEVTEGARRLGEPLADYLQRAAELGLRSLPGTAAEILDDEIRDVLCPDKITSEEWLEAHRTAHSVGIRSNVTMMYGSIERPSHWVRHFIRCRELQQETGGFTEFVGLPFVHMAAPIYLQKNARRGPTFRENLLVHAVARIAFDGLIDHIQASWVKIGFEGVLQLLQAGVDDLGGTLINENISRAAGAEHGQFTSENQLQDLVEPLGRRLVQRTTLYDQIPSGNRLPVKQLASRRPLIPVAGV